MKASFYGRAFGTGITNLISIISFLIGRMRPLGIRWSCVYRCVQVCKVCTCVYLCLPVCVYV